MNIVRVLVVASLVSYAGIAAAFLIDALLFSPLWAFGIIPWAVFVPALVGQARRDWDK